ncbi:hypothetical protein ACH4GE_38980 [Streptomyces tendae]|uniref:hypothetical protein n=1 Tax=Streptomyces tendae TaxID=1932 RepID=UPI0037AAE4E8
MSAGRVRDRWERPGAPGGRPPDAAARPARSPGLRGGTPPLARSGAPPGAPAAVAPGAYDGEAAWLYDGVAPGAWEGRAFVPVWGGVARGA